jgi:hypothetical protein
MGEMRGWLDFSRLDFSRLFAGRVAWSCGGWTGAE